MSENGRIVILLQLLSADLKALYQHLLINLNNLYKNLTSLHRRLVINNIILVLYVNVKKSIVIYDLEQNLNF